MNTTKVLATKILSVAALATAFALSPTAAKAQVAFGVQIGRPAYVHVEPRYPIAPYYPDRRYDFDRRDEFFREQAWRDREFRDHRDFDHRHFDDHRRW